MNNTEHIDRLEANLTRPSAYYFENCTGEPGEFEASARPAVDRFLDEARAAELLTAEGYDMTSEVGRYSDYVRNHDHLHAKFQQLHGRQLLPPEIYGTD